MNYILLLINNCLSIEERRDALAKQLNADLNAEFHTTFTISRNRIFMNDLAAKGSSHIDFKFKLNEDGNAFDLRVECVLFINRIILSFDNPEVFKYSINKIAMRKLKDFSKIGNSNFLIEFEYLTS